MAEIAMPTLAEIFRYPVKGLSPEPMERVEVAPGEALPFDRAYAIENGPGRFNPEMPQHLPKVHFLMLMRDERLATIQTRFDDATQTLTIYRAGKQVARGQLTTQIGRSMIEQFMAAYMKSELRGAPKIVSAPGHTFSDVAAKCLHIVNLSSLAELERAAGRPLNRLRFRPNLVIAGLPAWVEFTWLGKEISVGQVGLAVFKRTERCAATNVDPETGARDMAVPAVLQRTWGHTDFGVYASVLTPGTLTRGDVVRMPMGEVVK